MKNEFLRALVEVGFIILLFYSNLLMGEFTRSGAGNQHDFLWAIVDIFTWQNFIIAVMTAFIGHVIFDWLRGKF